MKRKLMAYMLTFTLVLSVIPVISTAQGDLSSNGSSGASKATVELVYMEYNMGVSDANISTQPGESTVKTARTNLRAGEEFLVGIRIKDIKNIPESKQGMYGANFTIKYDPEILECEDKEHLTAYASHRVATADNVLYQKNGGKAPYKIVADAMGIVKDRNVTGESDGCTAKVNIAFNYKDALSDPTYTGLENVLVGAVKFKVRKVPGKGKKVLGFALKSAAEGGDSGFQTTGFGRGNSAGAYELAKLSYDTRQIYNFRDAGVDIFPSGVGTEGKVNLYMDFLGAEQENAHPEPGQQQPVKGLRVNDVFWVGIRVSDMTKDNWPALENHGIETWIMTLNFDKQFIKPYTRWNYQMQSDAGQETKNFKDSVKKYSFGEDGWPRGYDWIEGTSIEQDCKFDKAEGTVITNKATSRGMRLGVGINVAEHKNPEMRFYQNDNPADMYLYKIPFIVDSIPQNGEKVLEISFEPESMNVSFMNDDETLDTVWTGLWEPLGYHEKTFEQNMRNWFYFHGNLDLFPAGEAVNTDGLKYGNSPYGLIMADVNISDEQKESYKQSFVANRYSFVEGKVPEGGQTGIKYRPDAWESKNYDKDPFAVFAYSGESFTDPGLDSPKKSDGSAVQEAEVKRSIEVDVIPSRQSGGASVNPAPGTSGVASLEEMAKESRELMARLNSEQARSIVLSNGYSELQIDDLKALNIRPGIYTLKYEYPDVDGKPAIIKQRKIIMLYKRGDANLSGEINGVDSNMVLDRFLTPQILGKSMKDTAVERGFYRLYKYRICDVNMDGNVNAVDALSLQ